MTRLYVSCAPLQHCRLQSVRLGTRARTPFALVPFRLRSADRLSRSLPSCSTRESVNVPCACQRKGTLNELTIVQQTTTAVEVALKKHSTVLWHLKSEEPIDAGLCQEVQECTPCDADLTARHQIIAKLNSLVKSGLCNQSGMHIDPYGSFQSKLYFSTGDLDLSIEGTYTQLSSEGGSEVSVADLAQE